MIAPPRLVPAHRDAERDRRGRRTGRDDARGHEECVKSAIAVDVDVERATRARWGGGRGDDAARRRFPEVFPHVGAVMEIVGGARMKSVRCEG